MIQPAARKTAILINSPEIYFLNKADCQDFYIFTEKGTPLEAFAQKNFKKEKIITYSYNRSLKTKEPPSLTVDDLLDKTNITKRLLENKIDYFFIPYRSSKKAERWAKKHGLRPIVTPLSLQDKFENKRFFDDFLKANRIISPPSVTLKKIKNNRSYVIQEAKISDFFRTKFFKKGSELTDYCHQKKVPIQKFVIREYLPGFSVGVSLFIDRPGNYFFSALRRQCFIYQHGFPKKFIGVQWLPTNFFQPSVIIKINRQLKKLAVALAKSGFFGVANVDLIIYRQRPYILECNPRLSMSMPQAFSVSSLTAFSDSWRFFLNTFYQLKEYQTKQTRLPKSNFQGAVLDIENKTKITIKKILPLGVYKAVGNQIIFVSGKLNDFNQKKDCFFLFHELEKGQVLGRGYSLCTIFSNSPLFDLAGGTLNSYGNQVYNYFSRAFILLR